MDLCPGLAKFKENKLLILILLVGFVLSMSYALYFNIQPSVDAKAYDSIALSLVHGTGYVETAHPDLTIGRAGPGYEFFLAIIYKIFGHHLWIVWLFQSLLHTGSALLIYLIILKLFKEIGRENLAKAYGLFASIFYISFIDLLEFPAMLLGETLYLFLILFGTYFAIILLKKPRMSYVCSTAVIMTLAILVRATAFFPFLILLGFLLWHKYYKYSLVFIIICASILTPWTVRNYITYHRFIITNSIIGYDLWVGNNPKSPQIGELATTTEIENYFDMHGLLATNDHGIKEVIKIIETQPLEFIRIQLIKTSIYFSAARPAAFWFHLKGLARSATALFSNLYSFVLFSLGLSGLVWFGYKKQFPLIILFALAAPISVIGIVVETRYRYQFYPMLIILGTLFVSYLVENKKCRQILLWMTVLVASNTVFDIIMNASRVLARLKNIL